MDKEQFSAQLKSLNDKAMDELIDMVNKRNAKRRLEKKTEAIEEPITNHELEEPEVSSLNILDSLEKELDQKPEPKSNEVIRRIKEFFGFGK
ncbi:hypothetical protein [Bacillus sp. AK128]